MYVASVINPRCLIEQVIQFHWGPGYSYELQDYYFAFDCIFTSDSACHKFHTFHALDLKHVCLFFQLSEQIICLIIAKAKCDVNLHKTNSSSQHTWQLLEQRDCLAVDDL